MLLKNSLSETDWLSEPHSLSKTANSLSECKTLEDVKLESSALSMRPARSARTLSLLMLSAPRLT
ncbi:hypothetical protein JHK82_026615 [Glycine max]|nr:hypothetical protein JHK85_027236 [Glycine max]KAG5002602.1 hypothetical protein JHK86_026741 [Glycine max]KAG5125780.1 hypothetical protein JHK82_026615 [Glycine max]KAG5150381.1 hypothetical protein JHK84_026853 [Glycine max]